MQLLYVPPLGPTLGLRLARQRLEHGNIALRRALWRAREHRQPQARELERDVLLGLGLAGLDHASRVQSLERPDITQQNKV